MQKASSNMAKTGAGFAPTVVIEGRPVVIAAIDGSSRSKDCYPIAVSWSGSAHSQAAESLIRPPALWIRQGGRLGGFDAHDPVLDRMAESGEDPTDVGRKLREVARQNAVVTLVPYIDCAGLQKLLSLQTDPVTLTRLSALDVATAIAAELGLGEGDFALAAADAWGTSLGRHPVARRVEAGTRMIQATIDAAAGLGLLGARTSIEIAASLPPSKLRASYALARLL